MKESNRGLSTKAETFGAVCEYEAVRSYFPDGTLYCDSPCDVACEKPFRGRPAETTRLKVGEVAWWWCNNRICPCLVAVLPYTDEYYWQRVAELGHEMALDYTDDSYKVYTCAWGHEHPECWRCMPYYGKISKRVLQRLQACKRREETVVENWRKSRGR